MDHAETLAKHLFETIYPGARMEYHDNQSHSIADFDLHHSDGALAAVEVTSSVDQSLAETNAAITDLKKGGGRIQATLCRKSWNIHPERDAKINKLRAKADEHLAAIEQTGLEKFFGPPSRENQAVARIYKDLGVFSGSVLSINPGWIFIASPTEGGAVGANHAIDAALLEVHKPDNLSKLGRANFEERHLAVYVGPCNFLPWSALRDFIPPSAVPKLPPEITDLWLFSELHFDGHYAVWHASTNSVWRSIGPVVLPNP